MLGSALSKQDEGLQAAVLLALTQLMAVDPGVCDANLQLLFTLLHLRCASGLRCLCVAASAPGLCSAGQCSWLRCMGASRGPKAVDKGHGLLQGMPVWRSQVEIDL